MKEKNKIKKIKILSFLVFVTIFVVIGMFRVGNAITVKEIESGVRFDDVVREYDFSDAKTEMVAREVLGDKTVEALKTEIDLDKVERNLRMEKEMHWWQKLARFFDRFGDVLKTKLTGDDSARYGRCGFNVNSCSEGEFEDREDTDDLYKWACRGTVRTRECDKFKTGQKIDGRCKYKKYECWHGTAVNKRKEGMYYKWDCQGLEGGETDNCKKISGEEVNDTSSGRDSNDNANTTTATNVAGGNEHTDAGTNTTTDANGHTDANIQVNIPSDDQERIKWFRYFSGPRKGKKLTVEFSLDGYKLYEEQLAKCKTKQCREEGIKAIKDYRDRYDQYLKQQYDEKMSKINKEIESLQKEKQVALEQHDEALAQQKEQQIQDKQKEYNRLNANISIQCPPGQQAFYATGECINISSAEPVGNSSVLEVEANMVASRASLDEDDDCFANEDDCDYGDGGDSWDDDEGGDGAE